MRGFDISQEKKLLADAATVLEVTAGMRDCDANWQKLADWSEEICEQHKGQRTEDFASDVLAAVMKHLTKLTVPEQGQEGGLK